MRFCERVPPILELFNSILVYNPSGNCLERDFHSAVCESIAFYENLMVWGNSLPNDDEDDVSKNIHYVVGSIRANMGWFLNAEYLYRSLDKSGINRTFELAISAEYSAIRAAYLRLFPELTAANLKVTERLDCLLTLCRLQLVFLASNFRSEIIRRRTRGPLDSETVRRKFDETMDRIREFNRLRREAEV